jgi:hypothetical protein
MRSADRLSPLKESDCALRLSFRSVFVYPFKNSYAHPTTIDMYNIMSCITNNSYAGIWNGSGQDDETLKTTVGVFKNGGEPWKSFFRHRSFEAHAPENRVARTLTVQGGAWFRGCSRYSSCRRTHLSRLVSQVQGVLCIRHPRFLQLTYN